MPTLDAKQTYKNLKKKGFEDSSSRSDDHKYLEFRHNGKVVLYTKISHGEKELGDSLIGQMKRQCKLEKSDFMDLANCPLSLEDYTAKLKEQGLFDIEE
ncbi:type II toxin-antitoxin system HicA family toxin [Spirosoma arcticum]